MNVYLAGPINGCSDSECKDWREDFKKDKAFDSSFRFSDPMSRDYRGRESESVKDIVEGDKKDIFMADIVVANCPKPSYGTAMEIIFAWELRKSVFVVSEHPSPWLTYHATAVLPTLQMAKEAILRVNPKTLEYNPEYRVVFGGR